MTLQEYQLMHHTRQLITGLMYFGTSLNSTFFKKEKTKKYYVFMKMGPLIGRHICIGRRLHVNQPSETKIDGKRNKLEFDICIEPQKIYLQFEKVYANFFLSLRKSS